MTSLSRREEMATRIACAILRAPAHVSSIVAASQLELAEVSAKLADRLIDECARHEKRSP